MKEYHHGSLAYAKTGQPGAAILHSRSIWSCCDLTVQKNMRPLTLTCAVVYGTSCSIHHGWSISPPQCQTRSECCRPTQQHVSLVPRTEYAGVPLHIITFGVWRSKQPVERKESVLEWSTTTRPLLVESREHFSARSCFEWHRHREQM